MPLLTIRIPDGGTVELTPPQALSLALSLVLDVAAMHGVRVDPFDLIQTVRTLDDTGGDAA